MSQVDRRLVEAYAHCRELALGHYENFPVGSVLIPKNLRPHFFALYAFMRTADDFADLPHYARTERLELLADWRTELRKAFEGHTPSDNIFLALQHTVRTFDLVQEPFDLLLDAFEFDANGELQFRTYDDLHWYTQRSAEPVGQLVLSLFGYRDEKRIQWSNEICTALQLLNFVQDAKQDLEQGRCYFPVEDYSKFGIKTSREILFSNRAGELMLLECDRIEAMIDRASVLSESVKGRLKYELRAVTYGAKLMIAKIRGIGGGTVNRRPVLTKADHRAILLKSLVGAPKRT